MLLRQLQSSAISAPAVERNCGFSASWACPLNLKRMGRGFRRRVNVVGSDAAGDGVEGAGRDDGNDDDARPKRRTAHEPADGRCPGPTLARPTPQSEPEKPREWSFADLPPLTSARNSRPPHRAEPRFCTSRLRSNPFEIESDCCPSRCLFTSNAEAEGRNCVREATFLGLKAGSFGNKSAANVT